MASMHSTLAGFPAKSQECIAWNFTEQSYPPPPLVLAFYSFLGKFSTENHYTSLFRNNFTT